MDFPIVDLMDASACYVFLVRVLHPEGLHCPGCSRADGLGVHARDRTPVLDYQCRHCGRVFNAYTGTPLQKTRRSPAAWVLILRGIVQGVPTARLARELGCDRMHLLGLRHRLQGTAARAATAAGGLTAGTAEADEMYQNAGEKGRPHRDPDDPPRRRANKQRGHGTFANDRPPVIGVVDRATGAIALDVVAHSNGPTLIGFVTAQTGDHAQVYTDEWGGYHGLPGTGWGHATVNHSPGQREWARDDDGDGIREVHVNTMEGLWAAVRTYLRPFRGVSKYFLKQYAATFQWAYNLKSDVPTMLRVLLGRNDLGTSPAS